MSTTAPPSHSLLTKTLSLLSLNPSTPCPKTHNVKFPFCPSHPSPSPPQLSLKLPRNVGPIMGTYNVQVVVEDGEPEDRLLNRFRREVMRAGVIYESKRRRFFETSREKKKRKSRDAARRNRKRRVYAKPVKQDNTEEAKKEVDDFKDDNWDLPEGDLPY